MEPPEPFGIDSGRAGIARRDAKLLQALVAKYRRYLSEGRGREAHGVGSALLIVWRAVCAPAALLIDVDITVPQAFDEALTSDIEKPPTC